MKLVIVKILAFDVMINGSLSGITSEHSVQKASDGVKLRGKLQEFNTSEGMTAGSFFLSKMYLTIRDRFWPSGGYWAPSSASKPSTLVGECFVEYYHPPHFWFS